MADKTYNLKFKMSDGSTVDAGNFVVPEGPQGPKGDTPTKDDIGLGNVPNVSTNNQTPTYTVASALAALASGEKLSVAMGKIAKAVSSLISHIADKNNPHAVTANQAGAAPAVESTVYPGCYYRTVNGEIEWINPPMITDTEYRTTERYEGKAVYKQRVSTGALPTNGEIEITVPNAIAVFYICGNTAWGYSIPYEGQISARASGNKIIVKTYADMGGSEAAVFVSYIKG